MENILIEYGLDALSYDIEPIGTGHIHQTYLLKGKESFVLQRVNKLVFTKPEVIAQNLRITSDYLSAHHPDYLFLSPVKTTTGKEMVYDTEGFPWRMFPYVENTATLNEVTTEAQAFQAAKGFAELTKNLHLIDTNLFKPTIDKFHDLNWRYFQFQMALKKAPADVIQTAKAAIEMAHSFAYLVDQYNTLINSHSLQTRITHNDTKINNILFSSITQESYCVIDLDTLMPGYFIYDLGDMVRTMVSPVSEEEKDFSKITFRKPIYQALISGYLSQMEDTLSREEKMAMPFAGMMMTYIMALRFLADYLKGNVYYHIAYQEQNLVRAENQLTLLTVLSKELSFS
jgi:Ser/Thr protein kinase RdoA (MazF antagonist)